MADNDTVSTRDCPNCGATGVRRQGPQFDGELRCPECDTHWPVSMDWLCTQVFTAAHRHRLRADRLQSQLDSLQQSRANNYIAECRGLKAEIEQLRDENRMLTGEAADRFVHRADCDHPSMGATCLTCEHQKWKAVMADYAREKAKFERLRAVERRLQVSADGHLLPVAKVGHLPQMYSPSGLQLRWVVPPQGGEFLLRDPLSGVLSRPSECLFVPPSAQTAKERE